MWYASRDTLGQLVERGMVSRDPRLPFLPTPEGGEYRVAAPLFGPWYWWPFGPSMHLPPESYYNPLTYPYPAETGNLIPRWSGAAIQPGNLDPVAYELAAGGMGQLIQQHLEDPTGGAFWDYDPMGPDPLGPGESVAVAWQWASQLKPRGFSALVKS